MACESREEKKTQPGRIEVVLGPMFCGKTEELLRRVGCFTKAQLQAQIFYYAQENSFMDCGADITEPTYPIMSLDEIERLLHIDTQVIAISGGHFFPDIAEVAERMANGGKIVLISALDGDADRRPFPCIAELIPLAETFVKLVALCEYCGQPAAFTTRISERDPLDKSSYVACCRRCRMARERPFE